MSGEIRDWLADLRGSDPPAAVQVGQALIALIGGGPSLGPPVVITRAGFPGAPDLPRELDGLYQSRLEQMGDMRQHLAEAATLVRDIEHQVAELQAQEAKLADQRWRALQEGKPDAAAQAVDELATVQGKLAELRRLLPGVVEAERQLRTKHHRLQASVNAFLTRKETLKATYTTAEADRESRAAIPPLGLDADAHGGPREGAETPGEEAAPRLRHTARPLHRHLRFSPPPPPPIHPRPAPPR